MMPVYTHGNGIIVADVGSDESCSHAASYMVGEHIGEISRESNILGRELTKLDVVFVHLLHFAIVDVLPGNSPRATIVDSLIV